MLVLDNESHEGVLPAQGGRTALSVLKVSVASAATNPNCTATASLQVVLLSAMKVAHNQSMSRATVKPMSHLKDSVIPVEEPVGKCHRANVNKSFLHGVRLDNLAARFTNRLFKYSLS